MKPLHSVMLGAAFLASVLLNASALGRPTTGGVTAGPAIEAPQLSPGGRTLIHVRRPQPGDPAGLGDVVMVTDISDLEAPRQNPLNTGDADLLWAAFANDSRLLVALQQVVDVSDQDIIVDIGGGRLRQVLQLPRAHIMAMNLDGSGAVRLFGAQEARFNRFENARLERVADFLPHDHEHVLAPARTGSDGRLNLFRVNVLTGEADRVESGGGGTAAWFTNADGEAVMRLDVSPRGGYVTIRMRPEDARRWRDGPSMPTHEFGRLQRDMQWVARSDNPDEVLVFATSAQTERTGLFRYSLSEERLLDAVFDHPEFDVNAVKVDPFTGLPLAVVWADERLHVEPADPALAGVAASLAGGFAPDALIEPLQAAGGRVLLRVSSPTDPGRVFIFETESERLLEIGSERPILDGARMAQVSVHRYQARDGTELFGYLTSPEFTRFEPPSLVVLPHGGPERRDHYAFDEIAQLLAADGHVVFQPQFRGSFGFGRAFAEAGNGRWGDLVQHDITDGVLSLIEAGLADGERVCAAGWSFGGYSALMQAINEPDLYRCVIAGGAVTDLPAMLEFAEDAAGGEVTILRDMMGAQDAAALAAFSPARRASEITVPVLLVHGERDEVVPYDQSTLMAEALDAAGVRHDLVTLRGGHSPRGGDLRRFIRESTAFLERNLTPARTGPNAAPKP
ncbi:MAG: prolyl oligopeptidase family serine peptidase [Oceanicaulis sp.]